MKIASTLVFCAATLTASLAAQAGVRAVDVPRISNGSTGFIGVMESVHTPRSAWVPARGASTQAGEASTTVNGQPNGHPGQSSTSAWHPASGAVMGAASLGSERDHPLWGTPD